MKRYWLYNPITLEYSGYYDAQESPLALGTYIQPRDSTDIEPPYSDGTIFSIRWNGLGWDINKRPEPTVPKVEILDALQLRLRLNKLGIRSRVESFIAGSDIDVQDYWRFSSAFTKDECSVNLGISKLELEELYK